MPMVASSTVAMALSAGATVIVTFAWAVHPLLSVTVTVYVVVTSGLASGDCIDGLLSPATGSQLYV